MSSIQPNTPVSAPFRACTICRDVELFDLLIEDMEQLLGEDWGDIPLADAYAFLGQPDASALEFVAIAIDHSDEADIPLITKIIEGARERGVRSILVAEDVSPAALHSLLRAGADEFIPYPLPEGELARVVEQLQQPAPEAAAPVETLKKNAGGDGALIAVQPMAGGAGATTFAVNLAWELANQGGAKTKKKEAVPPPSVCLVDLGLQAGSISTYLDLPRREAVFELMQDVDSIDEDSFGGALVKYDGILSVFTAPPDLIPLDMLSPDEVQKILDVAASCFDYVVVDMPQTFVSWSEAVLTRSDIYFGLLELDMRSAQNVLRVRRALEQEGLPFDKIRFVLNRAPKFTDLAARNRAKRLAESLGISIDTQLPDGGKPVLQACDHGMPLAVQTAKNPLRKEIAKLAETLHAFATQDSAAA